jgi:hypothetical protein
MQMSTVIYAARRILTMNPNRAFATHVAVRDGRILGAGPLDELKGRHADVPLDLVFGLDRYGGSAGDGEADCFASWFYQ